MLRIVKGLLWIKFRYPPPPLKSLKKSTSFSHSGTLLSNLAVGYMRVRNLNEIKFLNFFFLLENQYMHYLIGHVGLPFFVVIVFNVLLKYISNKLIQQYRYMEIKVQVLSSVLLYCLLS